MLINKENVQTLLKSKTIETRPARLEHYGGSKKGEIEDYTEYWDELNYRWTASKEMATRNYILNQIQFEVNSLINVE